MPGQHSLFILSLPFALSTKHYFSSCRYAKKIMHESEHMYMDHSHDKQDRTREHMREHTYRGGGQTSQGGVFSTTS